LGVLILHAYALYSELKGWQSGIGSLLGFIALMVGALWNFRLNRRRDAALRAEEVVSVAAALYGEIALLRIEAANIARAVANAFLAEGIRFDTHFLSAHQISEPMLYKALASKLGILPADLIIGITEFYSHIQQLKIWLPLLVDNPERGYGYGPTCVLIPARDAVFDVDPTLRYIERICGMRNTAQPVNLGAAEGVIDMEEHTHAS